MTKTNLIAASIALVVAGGFLYSVLTPPSYFNALPFALHQLIFKEVTPSGEVINTIEEATFVKIFDTVNAVLIFLLIYTLIKRIMKMTESTP